MDYLNDSVYWIILHGAIALSAFFYSSVGHGGASAYLAVLALFSFPRENTAFTALILNIFVSATSLIVYVRAGGFAWRLAWPFITASVPAAFLGGLLPVSSPLYSLLLGLALALGALRILGFGWDATPARGNNPGILPSLIAGGVIGFVSGMVGIGGGVFLSPALMLFWSVDIRKIPPVSAFFILVNSISALCARFYAGVSMEAPQWESMLCAALIGGWLGAHFGARRWSGLILRRVLAGVLLLASFKLFSLVI